MSSASQSSINAFLALPDEQKKTALGKMSPEVKQSLLTGIKSRQIPPGGYASEGDIGDESDTITGGASSELGGLIKGSGSTFFGPPTTVTEKAMTFVPGLLPVSRMVKGQAEAEKEAFRQGKKQIKTGVESFRSGDIKGGIGEFGRAAVTDLSMLDPFATSAVVNINRNIDEGKQRTAMGGGAIDILALWSGSRTLRGPFAAKLPSETKQVAHLTSASEGGGTTGLARAYKTSLPEMATTAEQIGKPSTIGDVANNIQKSLERTETQFNLALQPLRGQKYVPIEVSDELMRRANRPNLSMTPDGMEESKALKNAATSFQKPWTWDQIDLERHRRFDARMAAKTSEGRNTAIKSNVNTEIDQVVEDKLRDIEYDKLDQVYPDKKFRKLKERQSALIHLKEHLEGHIKKLEDTQAVHEAKGFIGKRMQLHGYGSPHRLGAYMSRLSTGKGPMETAGTSVRKAFGPTTGAQMRRAGVLSLPLSHLVRPQPSKLPPPPSVNEDEE